MSSSARKPRLNHVAMSMPADALDDEGRAAITKFYGDVFGWMEYDMQDRRRLVMRVHSDEQFVFLIADDPPMTCARLDHFGLSVGAESELDDILARAKAWQARDDRVEIVDKQVDDHEVLAITSIYIRYLLPMMIEIQWWDFKGGESGADRRGGGAQSRPGEKGMERA